MSRKGHPQFIKKPPLQRREKIIIWVTDILSAVLALAGIASCLEIEAMDQNLSGVIFFILFATIGLIMAIVLSFWLKATIPDSIKRRVSATDAALLVFFFFGVPAVANIYNRYEPRDPQCATYPILDLSFSHSRNRQHLVFIIIRGEKQRVQATHDVYHALENKQDVKICIAKGRLGFDFVSEVSVAK